MIYHIWGRWGFCVKWGLNEDHFSSLVLMRTKSSIEDIFGRTAFVLPLNLRANNLRKDVWWKSFLSERKLFFQMTTLTESYTASKQGQTRTATEDGLTTFREWSKTSLNGGREWRDVATGSKLGFEPTQELSELRGKSESLLHQLWTGQGE